MLKEIIEDGVMHGTLQKRKFTLKEFVYFILCGVVVCAVYLSGLYVGLISSVPKPPDNAQYKKEIVHTLAVIDYSAMRLRDMYSQVPDIDAEKYLVVQSVLTLDEALYHLQNIPGTDSQNWTKYLEPCIIKVEAVVKAKRMNETDMRQLGELCRIDNKQPSF